MTRAELEEAVRAILLEQMGGPQVLSLDLPQVQVTDADRLDTGNPRDRVWTHDLLTLSQSPRLGAGLMVMENTTFPWHLTYDEIDYVIEGTLTVHAQVQGLRLRHRRARPGDFHSQGQPNPVFRPGIRPVFVCDLSRRLAESAVLNLPGQNKSPSQRGCYEAGSS